MHLRNHNFKIIIIFPHFRNILNKSHTDDYIKLYLILSIGSIRKKDMSC